MPLALTPLQQAIFNAFDTALDTALAGGVNVGGTPIDQPAKNYSNDSVMAMPQKGITGTQQRSNIRQTFRQALSATLVAALVPRTYLDTSGTPGNATADTDIGRSAIANGATTVTITNSKIAPTSVVVIAPETQESLTFSAVPGSGSLVVSLSAATSGAWVFRWAVLK